MKKRITEEQIVRILKEAETAGSAREVIRKHNISEHVVSSRRGYMSTTTNGHTARSTA